MKFILPILFFLSPLYLYADIVYLRDGKILQGKIIRQTLTRLELKTKDGNIITIDKSEVRKISYISDEEIDRLRQRKPATKKENILPKKPEEPSEPVQTQIVTSPVETQEEQAFLLPELPKIEEFLETKKKTSHIHVQTSFGTGNYSFPLNQFYHYLYYYSSLLSQFNIYQPFSSTYLKELPVWIWSGNLSIGLSYHYQNFTFQLKTNFLFQNLDPDFHTENNRNYTFFQNNMQINRSRRYTQNRYRNQFNYFVFTFDTEDTFPLFWNYIFPYFSIGYLIRDLQFESKLTTTNTIIRVQPSGTSFTYEVPDILITENRNKQNLVNTGLLFTFPFRFLRVYDSQFLFEFSVLMFGASRLQQNFTEQNRYASRLHHAVQGNIRYNGSFSGRIISFLWKNEIPLPQGRRVIYFKASREEFETVFRKVRGQTAGFSDRLFVFPVTESILSLFDITNRDKNAKNIKESYMSVELGLQYGFPL